MEIVGSPARLALIDEVTRHHIIYCYFLLYNGEKKKDKGYAGPQRTHYCCMDRKFVSGAGS